MRRTDAQSAAVPIMVGHAVHIRELLVVEKESGFADVSQLFRESLWTKVPPEARQGDVSRTPEY